MADIAIKQITYKSAFMASMWRGDAVQARIQLGIALECKLPDVPNCFIEHDGRIAACLSPGRYLVLSESKQDYADVADRCDADLVSMVQLDHSRDAFRLSGEQAARLLMKGVAIDLDQSTFPVGSLFQSSIHDIGLIALRRELLSFDLLVYKSFGASFHHWLKDAAMEFR